MNIKYVLLCAVCCVFACGCGGNSTQSEAQEASTNTAATASIPEAAPVAEASAPTAEASAPTAAEADQVSIILYDDVKIMKSEIDGYVADICAQYEQSGMVIPEAERSSIRLMVIEQLALQKALEIAADKAGIVVTDEELNALIADEFPPNWEEILAEAGQNKEEFLEDLKKNIKIDKFITANITEVVVTDEEAKAQFDTMVAELGEEILVKPESVTASHILLKCTDEDSEAKKAEIIKLRERILAGEKFADVAKEKSDCPSKANGGSLGEFGRGQMVPEFEVAAFSQEIGKVGEPVKTQYGWHIILVEAKNEGGKITFDEIKDNLKQSLKMQKESVAVEAVIEKIKKEANIQILEKAVESAPVTPESARELPVWAK